MPIIPFEGKVPKIHPSAFVAPNAIVLGDVEIAEGASIWYGCVLRGDLDPIKVGARSNIQDNSVLHTDTGKPCLVGEDVTVGHLCIIHGCRIGPRSLIGMGSTLLNGSVVEEECLVGAKALIAPGKVVKARSLMMGVPARFVRELTDDDVARQMANRDRYVKNGQRHTAALEEFQQAMGNL